MTIGIGKMSPKTGNENVTNEGNVLDFSTLETNNTAEFKKIDNFINDWIEKQVDDPQTRKSMAEYMSDDYTFDQWFDNQQDKIYQQLFDDLLASLDGLGILEEVKQDIRNHKAEVKKQIRKLEFQLTRKGHHKIADTLEELAERQGITGLTKKHYQEQAEDIRDDGIWNDSNVSRRTRRPGEPRNGREKHGYTPKLSKKERKAIQRSGEYDLIQAVDHLENGTDVYFQANQYIHPHNVDTWSGESLAKRHQINPGKKPQVRKALELFLDDETGNKEITRATLPLALFKKNGGFFDVMRSIQDIANDENHPMHAKVASWIYAGSFKGIKPKDLTKLGMTQPRKMKMVRILENAKRDDLLILAATLGNAKSIEDGIADLYQAEVATNRLETEKERFRNPGLEGRITEDTVLAYLCDWNVDGFVSAGQTEHQDGEKIGPLRRNKLKNIGDAGPQFGQAVLFTMDSVIKQLDITHNNQGENIVVQNIIREMYGQVITSGYLDDAMQFGQYDDLMADLADLMEPANLQDCTKETLAQLTKDYPYFHLMFKSAIFTMAGGETTKGAPNPANLDDVFRGTTLKTFEQGRQKSLLTLRNQVDTYLEQTNNKELKKLIESEGEVKVKHTIITGLMKFVDGLVIRGRLQGYGDLIDGDVQNFMQGEGARLAILRSIAKNLHRIIFNVHNGNTLGATLPIGFPLTKRWKWEGFSKDGRVKGTGQVFVGMGGLQNVPIANMQPIFMAGVRGEVEFKLTKASNVVLNDLKPAKYLGLQGELKGELNLATMTPEAQISAGISYSTNYIQQIKEAGDLYESAFENTILSESLFSGRKWQRKRALGSNPTSSQIQQKIGEMKQVAIAKLQQERGMSFFKNNYEKFRQTIDVVFGMLQKEFTRPGSEKLWDSFLVYDLMIAVANASVQQWRDGQIAKLHGALKMTGFSAGVAVQIRKAIMLLNPATAGAAITEASLTTQELPVDVYVEGKLSTWRMKHNANPKMMLDRQNKVMRGEGNDPFKATPRLKTADNYAAYYEALFNMPGLTVSAVDSPNGDGHKSLEFVYTGSTPTLRELLNIHATKDAIKDNLFALEGNTLTVGAEQLYAGTVVEGKGIRRTLSIGGPIIDKKRGLYKPHAIKLLKDDMGDYDLVPGVEDIKAIRWTEEKIETFTDGILKDFLDNVRLSGATGEKGTAVVTALEKYIKEMLDNKTFPTEGKVTFVVDDLSLNGSNWEATISHSVATVPGSDELSLNLESYDFQDEVSDIERSDYIALVNKLFNSSQVRKIDDPDVRQKFVDQKDAIKQSVKAKLDALSDEDVKKVSKVSLVYKKDTESFDVQLTRGSAEHLGPLKAGISYEKEVLDEATKETFELGKLEYKYKGELKELSTDIDAVWKTLGKVNATKVWNNPDYYRFMEAASNIDDPTKTWFMLDEGEMNQALGHLTKLLRSTKVADMERVATAIENLDSMQDKVIVMSRFKQILAYNQGLHGGKLSIAKLLQGRGEAYKKMPGPAGNPLSYDMTRIFDDASSEWSSADPGKGTYSMDLQEGLIGYTAFYRTRGISPKEIRRGGLNKRWSITGQGATEVLSGFTKEVTGSDAETVRREFFENFMVDEYSQKFVIDQVKEFASDKLDGFGLDTMTNDEIQQFIEQMLGSAESKVTLEADDGKTAELEFDLSWVVYLLGACGNRSYGFTINDLKITVGTPTTTVVPGENEVQDDPQTTMEDRTIDGEASGDGMTTYEGGDWEVHGDDYSVAMDPDADRYDIRMRLGTPLLKKKPLFDQPDGNINTNEGPNFSQGNGNINTSEGGNFNQGSGGVNTNED